MDSENKSPAHSLAKDIEETGNVSVLSGKAETFGVSKVDKKGSLEDHCSSELLPDVNGKGTDPSASVSSPPLDMKPSKGYGLKKWRRIKRDVTRDRNSSPDTEKMMIHELSNSVTNPSKRAQVYVERQQKSEGSVLSANPIDGNFGAPVGQPVDIGGLDSENGEAHSSRSSTSTSFPKMKPDMLPVMGLPLDKGKMTSLGRNNSSHSVQRGLQGKVRAEATKKVRGAQMNIEKENSRSSMESDLRSSNFVFGQGNHVVRNGLGGENGHEVQDGEGRFGNKGGYEDFSQDSKKERGENHASSSDQDLLPESLCLLQRAQEALEEEVLKFKEIGKGNFDPDLAALKNESFEELMSGEGVPYYSPGLPLEEELAKGGLEAELENLFKQRIEAEVEYLAISTTFRKMNQNYLSVDQKSTASELTANKLGENKGVLLKKDAEKLPDLSEDISSTDPTLKLQKRVCKYALCFLVQLLSLFIIFLVFIFKISSDYSEVVPT